MGMESGILTLDRATGLDLILKLIMKVKGAMHLNQARSIVLQSLG